MKVFCKTLFLKNNVIVLLRRLSFLIILSCCLWSGCKDDDNTVIVEPIEETVVYDDTPFELKYGNLPTPNLPEDNPLTVQGVELGRMLFYDKLLSKGEVQACATCHNQSIGFSDSLRLSIGAEELPGTRQSMAIFNMGWHSDGFFWDGRVQTLREQAIEPIQDPLEMNETLDNVVNKLKAEKRYQDQFVRAFENGRITWENMALALEQFMLSIVSYNSKYDKFLAGEVTLTESEERGRQLYFLEYNPFFPEFSGADCQHCHGGTNFENDLYMNNGLDTDEEFVDLGRETVTNEPTDRAKFKVPSLRNIAVTAPYMHDGRFNTLEEVVEHYNTGIKTSSTADLTVLNTQQTGLMLTEQDKEDLVNFMKTLTDEVYLTQPSYQSPF